MVAMVLSVDVSCFVACSRIFRGQSPLAATSRPFGRRINAEDGIVSKMASADASGRGSINLVLFSKISFSLLLLFFLISNISILCLISNLFRWSRDL
ncbi:hypothetical protein CMUS01_15011 [Colletotrichum musicola]|uniref:Uncharacterized protein n=1 Tax=Colletotrichum musicola TaxID=2175873 RepID=A0A8H6MP34_9PEZI|nr:hypothetical protein CMUS01_15011 [Colletotrichum musicola]